MVEVSLNEITKNYGGANVLNGLSLRVQKGEKAGLIGINGSGKTTLFRIIAGIEPTSSGTVSYRQDVKIAYLDQIPVFTRDTTAGQCLRESFTHLNKIDQKLKDLEKKFHLLSDQELDKAIKKYGDLQLEFENKGGYSVDLEIEKICTGLKINNLSECRFSDLSGGEKTRVLLARMLLQKPDLLLLDEPTNHLDLESIEWLESYLKETKSSVLIISHDRYFLDQIVSRIMELKAGEIEEFAGNYSFYLEENRRRRQTEMDIFKQAAKRIKSLKEAAERYRTWGNINSDNSAHMAKAKRCEKQIEELEKVKKPARNRKIRADFSNTGRSGKIVVRLQKIKKSYGENLVLRAIDLNLHYRQRVVLLGRNGCGKTTLFRIINQEIEPDAGDIYIGPSVKIGYLQQEVEFQDENLSLLDSFLAEYPVTQGEVRSILARFLFLGEDVFKKIRELSGGERVRFQLSLLMHGNVNFLLLDEPTNHLDILSREMLEQAIADFKGTVLFISHDRYLINKLSEKILELEEGKLQEYPGDYEYYRLCKSQVSGSDKSDDAGLKPIIRSQDEQELRRLKQKIRNIEENITWLESELEGIERKMLEISDYEDLNKMYERKCTVKDQITQLMEQWEYLMGEEEIIKK
ncbi:MAG: ABC-F family ATP-binding cassette domain-containing protein [Candidatus Cloacimonetes bacterium]|nr:ABC-F family ATP-binding cassette domain-containing protein [Candidatus Cloacimonadota bacterium]